LPLLFGLAWGFSPTNNSKNRRALVPGLWFELPKPAAAHDHQHTATISEKSTISALAFAVAPEIGRGFSPGNRPTPKSGLQPPGYAFLPRRHNLGKIGDSLDIVNNPSKKHKIPLANYRVGIHHHHLIEESVHMRS
jgi:hypothetical protein